MHTTEQFHFYTLGEPFTPKIQTLQGSPQQKSDKYARQTWRLQQTHALYQMWSHLFFSDLLCDEIGSVL